MLKPSFFNRQSTAVTLLCRPRDPEEALAFVRNARDDGADAVAFELIGYAAERRTTEDFRTIVAGSPLPTMFCSYRNDTAYGADDEARMEMLFRCAEAGAEVIDVPGDLYAPADFELTEDPAAIARQREAIAKAHALGAKVVMSSHVPTAARTADEVVAHLRAQEARGADMVKLVAPANTSEEFAESVRTLSRLNAEMKTPWVYLNSGRYGRLQRFMGPSFGCAVAFAVHEHLPGVPFDQHPTIASLRRAMAAIAWRE